MTPVVPADLGGALDGIELILLIGGPSGCGKTTFAERLIDGLETTSFLQGYADRLSRTDSKSLPRKTFAPGGLIVEFATNRLHLSEQLDATRVYIQALQQRMPVVGAYTIETGGWQLFQRYLKRMRATQFLHPGKLKTLSGYALAAGTQEGVGNWKALLAELGIENRSVAGASELIP